MRSTSPTPPTFASSGPYSILYIEFETSVSHRATMSSTVSHCSSSS